MTRAATPTIRAARLESVPQFPAFDELPGLGELCRTFSQATGWPLRYVRELKSGVELLWSAPVCPGAVDPAGYLRIDLGDAASLDELRNRVPLEAAERLAGAICRQLGRQWELQQTLWQREAELATAVPVIARTDEPQQLARRLNTIVRSAAEALRCPAATLYLLDEATTELKARSCWGLPAQRLMEPARPLARATADLEALLGHAVVLESPVLFERWNCPERAYQSAVVVPVSSPTLPLGTLWVYNDQARDYSAAEQNMLEIIAGRIATELEKERLLSERQEQESHRREWGIDNVAVNMYPTGPSHAPSVHPFEVAAWSAAGNDCGGVWHDWVLLADGRMAMILGDACDGGAAGAIAAATLRGLFRHDTLRREPPRDWRAFLRDCHETLAELSAGNHWAGVLLLVLDPRTGETELHSAGRPLALHIPWEATLSNHRRDTTPIIDPTRTTDKTRPDLILPTATWNEATPTWPERQVLPRDESRRRGHEQSPQREQTPAAPRKLDLPIKNWVQPTAPLGIGTAADIFTAKKLLLPGDLLIGVNRGLADVLDRDDRSFDLARVLDVPSPEYLIRADEVLEIIQRNLPAYYELDGCDLGTLILKHRLRG